MGGLSKKAYQLESIRQTNPLPSLTLDGGSLLFKTKRITSRLVEQAKITAEGIVDAYNVMGYQAVNIARYDLAGGLAFLQRISDRAEFPLLSANVVSKSTGKPIFTPKVIRDVGTFSIGIIGIIDSGSPSPFTAADDAEIIPWQEVLPGIVAELSSACDMIILLSNQRLLQNKEIVQTVPGIHIIIQSGTSSANLAPIKIGNTLIVQTAKQGKYLGWMKINWRDSRKWEDATLKEELAVKKRELIAVSKKNKSIPESTSPEVMKTDETDRNLAAEKERLLEEIRGLESTIDHENREHPPSTYTNHFIALETILPDNPQVMAIVEGTKQRVKGLEK